MDSSANSFANDEREDGELPFVDEHTIRIAASRELVWTALQRFAASSLGIGGGNPLARVLGTDPPAGFEVSARKPAERLTLVGRHRFSRYMLTFEVTEVGNGDTRLHATTYAAFPGVTGRAYRTLVIGTRAHVVATNRILKSIRRLSLELAVDARTPGPGE